MSAARPAPRAGPGGRVRSGLTRRGWSMLGAAGGLVCSGALLGTPEVVVAGTTTAALLGAARWWAARQPLGLTVVRDLLPRRLHAGRELEVRLRVTGRLPHGHVVVVEPVGFAPPAADLGRRHVRIPLTAAAGGAQLTYRIPTARRGRLRVGPTRLVVTDPFGLARAARRVRNADEILVWPVPIEVPRRRWPGAGDHRLGPVAPVPRGPAPVGEELLGLRPYEPGDDLRRIHWRTSARVDDLVVRQDDRVRPPMVTIVLDTRPPDRGGATGERFERAVSLAAGLATTLTRAEQPFTIVTTAGRRLGTPAVGRGGARGLAAALDALATVAPDAAVPARLTAALRRTEGVVVAVGPTAWDTDALGLRLRRAGRALVAVPVPDRPADAGWTP